MDLTKFVWLLSQQTLHFCRLDRFEDRYEGFPGPQALNSRFASFMTRSKDPSRSSKLKKARAKTFDYFAVRRRRTFVNCWHMSKHESAALWSIYAKQGDGIAIRSTCARLADSFGWAHRSIHLGMVQYVDHSSRKLIETDDLASCLWKRKSFAHELELRAVMQFGENELQGDRALTTSIFAGVDIKTLVERVYISPTSQIALDYVVKSLLEKYALDVPIERSDLMHDPLS